MRSAAALSFGRQTDTDGGGLTPLVFAARQDCLECAKVLVDARRERQSGDPLWLDPLLTATQNRHYKLAAYLLEKGANPNISNNGGWTPLYLATDNRNIEGGDYPVRKPDMDHLDFIKVLIDKGANVNARVCGVTLDAHRLHRRQHRNPHQLHHAMAAARTARRRSCAPRNPATSS